MLSRLIHIRLITLNVLFALLFWLSTFQAVLVTSSVVRVEQSVQCVCLCVRTTTVELHELWPRHLPCWFILTIYGPLSQVKVIGQSLRSQDKNAHFRLQLHEVNDWCILWMHVTPWRISVCWTFCAKVLGATSSEGFLVIVTIRIFCTVGNGIPL